MMKKIELLVLIAVVSFCACKTKSYTLSRSHIELERVMDEEYKGDPRTEKMITPYREKLEAQMNEVIGVLTNDLSKGQPQGTLGNWLADMIFDEVKEIHKENIDFALQNKGSIRVPQLAAGPITKGEIFEIMPFDNKITLLTLTGHQLKVALDHIAEEGGWPISDELMMTINSEGAVDIRIGDIPLDLTKSYTFALPDYVANVNAELLGGTKRKDMQVMMRDLYIDHIKRETEEGKKQSAIIDNRIKLANHE